MSAGGPESVVLSPEPRVPELKMSFRTRAKRGEEPAFRSRLKTQDYGLVARSIVFHSPRMMPARIWLAVLPFLVCW